ncbi:MAG TPA: NAD(P)/FAD-dependent oxidoreductase [Tepidisphaeraceae bacterium]|nr:NAD(P)/FAD-dependent oxidoreductase [Tepidisphaeraceae bacterium]
MIDHCDIVVIGAGAAGLTAGIFAGQTACESGHSQRIMLLDGAKAIGAKILVSGGSRCNVTHDQIRISDYNGSKNIVRNVLAAFNEQATVRWFESLGVRLKREETGKLFPVANSAKAVLAALVERCHELGVEICPQHRVHEVAVSESTLEKEGGSPGKFIIEHEQGQLEARRVILATGGRSLPLSGSDGFGYQLARRLGHTVTETFPALVPLVLDSSFFHAKVTGIAHEAELTTFAEGKLIDRRRGNLLWTHFGISGPVVMDASRHWVMAHAQNSPVELRCNLLPDETFESLEQRMTALARTKPNQTIGRTLGEKFPDRLVQALAEHVEIDPMARLGQLTREQRRRLIHALVALPLPVVHDRGWNYAEVTAGGVPLAEINYRTMQSRKQSGLYLIGEILDCDGRIGGFNFQWAWATGYLAGRAAAST